MTESRTRLLLDYPRLWIPVEEGEPECCCCGLHWGCEYASCGLHAFCSICLGRGHDEGHAEECATMPASTNFRRLDHDCPGCGKRHLDWQTCADEVWRRYKIMQEEGRASLGSNPWETPEE